MLYAVVHVGERDEPCGRKRQSCRRLAFDIIISGRSLRSGSAGWQSGNYLSIWPPTTLQHQPDRNAQHTRLSTEMGYL